MFADPLPPGPKLEPLGRNDAQAFIAAWNFWLPPKPPLGAPLGTLPREGGNPPDEPDPPGGKPPLPEEGMLTPCCDRHFWKAANDADRPEDDPSLVEVDGDVDPADAEPPQALRSPAARPTVTMTAMLHTRRRTDDVCHVSLIMPTVNRTHLWAP